MNVDINNDVIDVSKGHRVIRIALRHAVYVRDVVMNFDHYYSSVASIDNLVDFSKSAYHHVTGFSQFPILFQSFSESMETINQYLQFAKLQSNDIVLDLGAYSGLTSILFAQIAKLVIAVEADPNTHVSLIENTSRVNNIYCYCAAMWDDSQAEIKFSKESNLGSGAVDIIGNRGECEVVQTVTLSKLQELFELERVDFIKCDIEGTEQYIFNDVEFFKHNRPRMIVETHHNEKIVVSIIESLGYCVKSVPQIGSNFPLLECVSL